MAARRIIAVAESDFSGLRACTRSIHRQHALGFEDLANATRIIIESRVAVVDLLVDADQLLDSAATLVLEVVPLPGCVTDRN
jgi:hypothetical protein